MILAHFLERVCYINTHAQVAHMPHGSGEARCGATPQARDRQHCKDCLWQRFCVRLLLYRKQLVAHRSCVHLTQAGGKEHDLTGVQALRMRGAQSRDLPIQS